MKKFNKKAVIISFVILAVLSTFISNAYAIDSSDWTTKSDMLIAEEGFGTIA